MTLENPIIRKTQLVVQLNIEDRSRTYLINNNPTLKSSKKKKLKGQHIIM